MVSSFTNPKAEPDLFQHQVKIKTRNDKLVPINCVFMDTKPEGSDTSTIIAVHGAPGSHKDFKYIYPNLNGSRFIGINWPGMGYSSYDHDLVDDNEERVQIVQQTINELKLTNIIFCGHSRGSENALKMAALNKDVTTALILINPIGLRPHRGIRPYWVVCYFSWLWKTFPLGRSIFNGFLFWLYNKIGLRASDGNAAGVCLNLMRYADFEGQQKYIDILNRAKNVRVLTCYSGEDFLVEPRVGEEFASAFTDNKRVVCSSKDDAEVVSETQNLFLSGHRHISIFFEKDGHFLQKTRADFLSQNIKFFLSNTIDPRSDVNSHR